LFIFGKINKIMKDKKEDFWVECNVCKTQLKNWVGSTPCCGSIAFIVTDTDRKN